MDTPHATAEQALAHATANILDALVLLKRASEGLVTQTRVDEREQLRKLWAVHPLCTLDELIAMRAEVGRG